MNAADTTEDRVAMLHGLLNDAATKVGQQRKTISRQSEALEKIAGEAPFMEPSADLETAPPPNWGDDLTDEVASMLAEAFSQGYSRACWEMGQIADAALKTGEAK